jgi:TorA maturation chaperone TorD
MSAVTADAVDRHRAAVYDVLAAVFDGDVAALERALETNAFEPLDEELPGQALALSAPELDRDALELGYDNLFVVPGPHFVPPFASAHRDEPSADFESDSPHHEPGRAGELLGDPAQEMAQLYDRVGFSPAVGEGFPDHLAAQLSFLAVLARTASELEAGTAVDGVDQSTVRELEAATLDQLRWVETFADALDDRDGDGVFAALASFTSRLLAWDRSAHARPD